MHVNFLHVEVPVEHVADEYTDHVRLDARVRFTVNDVGIEPMWFKICQSVVVIAVSCGQDEDIQRQH